MTSSGSTRFHIKGYTLRVIFCTGYVHCFGKARQANPKLESREFLLTVSIVEKLSRHHQQYSQGQCCLLIFRSRYVFTYNMLCVSHNMFGVSHNMFFVSQHFSVTHVK